MTEYETSDPAAGEKKIWATPEIRDQSIQSATAQGAKTGWPSESGPSTGAPS
jgi:hypothetical protein